MCRAPWWQHGVIYQIYPRSFADSNGDGIGDLQGIIDHLDHLAGGPDSLGIDAVWISPFYPSPMRDFGYDVSDYTAVDSVFGDMETFDRLVAACHTRGIHVVIDLVLNHTSDEHPWFVQARASRNSPKHDWYLWYPGARGRKPNNWICQFEVSSAWWPNEQTDERYLGTFTRHQPEVNWRNPELREAMYDVLRFWLDHGVDGFRLDVVNWFIKDDQLRNNPRSLRLIPDFFQHHIYDRNQPETHRICKEMRELTDHHTEQTGQPRVLIGEVYTGHAALAASYYGDGRDELHLVFNFALLFQPWSAARMAIATAEWYALLPDQAWPTVTLSNHDQPRHASRYAAGRPGVTDGRTKVAAGLLLTVRGTPFLYYGEEIGMQNVRIRRSQLQDPLGRRTWPFPLGRDGERTPMQWSPAEHAGFTTGTPWLPLHPGFAERNVAVQRSDPASTLSWYRALIALRRARRSLSLGGITFIDLGHRDCMAYVRELDEEQTLVLLNLSDRPALLSAGSLPTDATVLLGTHRAAGVAVGGKDTALCGLEVVVAHVG
jgi:alpha-glucosidase